MQTAEIIKFQPREVRMADLDDGYTRIANELLEKIISFPFTLRQQNILLAIARKTYGYNKKTDWIGNKQLSELTGYAETRCSTIKNELIAMNVVITNGRAIGINKNMSEWNSDITHLGKTFTKTGKKTFTKTVNHSLPKRVNTKDNTTKDNINISPISPKGEINRDDQIILENNANELIEYYNSERNSHIRDNSPFMKALNKYSVSEIKLVIDWFALTGKQNAKPENICRMTRLSGYLSDAIKHNELKESYNFVVSKFNEICGERIGYVDDLPAYRIEAINNLINELSKKSDNPLNAIEPYFTALMDVSSELDIKNPASGWAMTFDYAISSKCLVKTREKINNAHGVR